MSKLQIFDEREESRIPFLRGILTRSLTRAGLSFEKAHALSTLIRDEVESRSTLTTTELRKIVHKQLLTQGCSSEARKYLDAVSSDAPVYVTDENGDDAEVPFSKGLLVQSLEICALEREDAYRIASLVEQKLYTETSVRISSLEIEALTYREIEAQESKDLAERYRKWRAFVRSGRSIILLIGGTTGTGKSTLSAELSHRLDIVRTQSTDMLREVMRLMIPENLLPTLHTSSFEAYKKLPQWELESDSFEEPNMITGYLSQADHVKLGIDGVLKRVQNEKVSLILEGVHIHPGIQSRITRTSDALVVPMVLAELKKKRLKKRLKGRGHQVASRRSARYLEHFEQIWDLQSFLLSEADRFNVPIIEGEDEDTMRRLVMNTVSEYVSRDALNHAGVDRAIKSELKP